VTLKRPRRRVILFWRHGIELEATIEQNPSWYRRRQSVTYRVVGWTGYSRDTSWRAAIQHWVHYQPKRIGTYNVFRSRRDNDLPTWTLKHASHPGPSRTIGRNRRDLARLIRTDRKARYQASLALQDPHAPDTLGWRVWYWDPKKKRLVSPHQGTVWETPELRVKKWDKGEAVRGVAGIHAARLPRDWRRAQLEHHGELSYYSNLARVLAIVGVVERFGKYVLGTEGWRAEIVVIRKLRAPNTKIGLELEKAYPDVEVYYEDR
jgi:hypothetical protein